MFFSQGCTIGCPSCNEDSLPMDWSKRGCASSFEPTLNDARFRTTNVNVSSATLPSHACSATPAGQASIYLGVADGMSIARVWPCRY